MLNTLTSRLAIAASLTLAASSAMAIVIPINTADPANGLTDIYSATFDGGLVPCTGSSPSYCSFFGGDAPAGRQIVLSPNPSGVANAVPGGIAGATTGSSLNLTKVGNDLQLTGGTIAAAPVTLTISGTTTVTPSGTAGFVLDPGLRTATLNANGQAEFLVNMAPGTAADFSTFSSIVLAGDCTGPLCALIPILSLDMNKYRLFVDFDPTFTSFTADFIGQTSNNSLVYATLNSTVIPVPAAVWLMASGLGLLAGFRRRVAV
ncbi:MAG: VPLPA-CTERM sorting domain-containing protein [Gammaproteobacteria bacterium]